jgi:hypothetical protein
MQFAPLKGSFMIISILGFAISAVAIYDRFPTWGAAFCVVFALMFIASIVSMTYAPISEKEP